MRIYVDADAFPGALKDILFRASERVGVPLVFVTNQAVVLPPSELISRVLVGTNPDEADDRIVELVEPGDLVITADVPLADRIVGKGAHGIDPRGSEYTHENIKERIAMRDLLDGLRTDGMVSGGPPTFNQKDVQKFANALDRWLAKYVATNGGE
jgi:hypothetical protein